VYNHQDHGNNSTEETVKGLDKLHTSDEMEEEEEQKTSYRSWEL
jgi:hypothetical protein